MPPVLPAAGCGALAIFFKPWLAPKAEDKLDDRLREAASYLGAVRDPDVLIAYADEHAARLAPAAAAPLDAYLETERTAARKNLFRYLKGKEWRKLLATMKAFVDANLPEQTKLGVVLPQLVAKADADVERYAGTLVAECPVEHLHALRIAIKRFRYLLEFTLALQHACTECFDRTSDEHAGSPGGAPRRRCGLQTGLSALARSRSDPTR